MSTDPPDTGLPGRAAVAPRTVGELVALLGTLPPDTPVYLDPEGDPVPMGPPALRAVVTTPKGFVVYQASWDGALGYCADCGFRGCRRAGHRLRRDIPVTPTTVLILEGGP